MVSIKLNFLKNIQDQAVKKKFKSPKMFRLEVEGAPKDLDFFLIDIAHTPIELDTEDVRYGFKKMNFPNMSQQVDITATFRDSEDERLRTWLSTWAALIDNGDGTSNPPNMYLKKVSRWRLGSSNPLSGDFNSSSLGDIDIPLSDEEVNIGGYDYGSVSNVNQLPSDIANGLAGAPQGKVDSVLAKYVPPQTMGAFSNQSVGRGIPLTGQNTVSNGFVETKTDEWRMWPSRVGEYNESREESGKLIFPVTFTGFRS